MQKGFIEKFVAQMEHNIDNQSVKLAYLKFRATKATDKEQLKQHALQIEAVKNDIKELKEYRQFIKDEYKA